MSTVRSILELKGAGVWRVSPETTVFDALVVMSDRNVGALVVTRADEIVGIFSERDYARKVELKGRTSHQLLVGDIMTPDPVSVGSGQSLEECMEIMKSRHIRHLPVLENHRLVGMITIRDAIKAILSEKEHTITQLENHIKGT